MTKPTNEFWEQLSDLQDNIDELNEWEQKFVKDMASKSESYPFTANQINKVEQIWEKLDERNLI
jgi:hypothetical protein